MHSLCDHASDFVCSLKDAAERVYREQKALHALRNSLAQGSIKLVEGGTRVGCSSRFGSVSCSDVDVDVDDGLMVR